MVLGETACAADPSLSAVCANVCVRVRECVRMPIWCPLRLCLHYTWRGDTVKQEMNSLHERVPYTPTPPIPCNLRMCTRQAVDTC